MKLGFCKKMALSIKTSMVGLCLTFGISVASAQEITAIDFNGDLIGKVIPDGKVVSFDNQLIGNITADSLIVDSDGILIGGVVPKGIAIGNDNRLLGKVNNDGTVRLATGKIVGKVLPNGLVVDESFSVLGAVLFPGLIYSDSGETVGRLTGDGLYSNLQGQNIGFVSPDGYAYRRVGNDFVIDGKLISSKMIIDSGGKFIGSIAPGGKVTDFDGKVIGQIRANGFAYDAQEKIIGRIVKSGYAFENNGKYLGFVTYNGEVVKANKVVGHLQIDGTVADTKGNTIGYVADISSTVTDAGGKYLGRIMPEGRIAKARNFIGTMGPRQTVLGTDGSEIGKLVASGPVFDYRGTLKAHALKNGQVILLSGTPVGTIYGNRVSDYNGRNIGMTFSTRLVINSLNQTLGVNGISSAFSFGEEKKYISPFGYVYNADGGIDGNLLPLGAIYNISGQTIASIYPNGDMVNNNAPINGKLTQYGYSIDDKNSILGKNVDVDYAVDYLGNSLGLPADGNMLLDKSLKNIAKILPDQAVVSDVNNPTSLMPVIGMGENQKMAIGYQGRFLGYINDEGIVQDLGASIIGKTGAGRIVFDNKGIAVGGAASYATVIDEQCEFIGVVTAQGDVKNYREVNMGKLLPNGQVFSVNNSVIGHTVDVGAVIDFGGNTIGTVSSSGKVLNFSNQNLGCPDWRGLLYDSKRAVIGKVIKSLPVMNFNNVIIGRSILNGNVVNSQSTVIGYIRPDDSVSSQSGLPTGILFRYRYAFDNNNRLIGTVNDKAEVINEKGEQVGTVDFDGYVVSNDVKIGYALYDMYIYDNNYLVIGYISADGQVLSLNNRNMGSLSKGFLVDGNGKVIGRGNRDFHIRDNLNAIVGELQLNGSVINSQNETVGTLGSRGEILDGKGNIVAVARPLQFYEPEYKQALYDQNGRLIGYVDQQQMAVDANGRVVGRIGAEEKRLALTADGRLLGHIDDEGNVFDVDGKLIGQVRDDGTIVDKNGKIIGKSGEKRKLVYGKDNKVIGYVNDDGKVVGTDGRVIADVVKSDSKMRMQPLSPIEERGAPVYDQNGNIIGYVSTKVDAIDNTGKTIGRVGDKEERLAISSDGTLLGYIDEQGNVIDNKGNVIGKVGADGTIVDAAGRVIGKAGEKRKLVYDKNNNIIGYVDGNGNVVNTSGQVIGRTAERKDIVDSRGNVIGQLDKDGTAIGLDGTVIGNTKLDWYQRPENYSSEDLPEIGARTVAETGQYKRSLNIALTPDGEYLGDILENGNVVDKKGTVIGKLLPDGLVVDKEGSLIGIEEAAKKSDTGEMFVPAGTFGQGGAYGIGTGGGNLGPGGGFGPGERYDPQRAAALQTAQNERRKGMYVGKISSNVRKEAFDGYQKDWEEQGIDKVISSWRVDMSEMILADKPIPAVIARSIDTQNPVPITAFVERNVYAEDGRNVVIPAGSRLMGELGGTSSSGSETSSESARITIIWQRLIRPDGVLFTFQGETGDAQGRGGALGYVDQQLGKKYGMPLITTLLTSATSYMMATDEDETTTETETSRQQAANDARQNFIDQMNQIFEMILADKTNIRSLTYVPAGTRIIVYPKVDLWLRTLERDMDVSTNMKKKDVLIDDKEAQDRIATQAAERRVKQAGGSTGDVSSEVVYESEKAEVQPVLLDDNKQSSGRTPTSTIGATPPPPPSTGSYAPPSSGSSGSGSGVPQLF